MRLAVGLFVILVVCVALLGCRAKQEAGGRETLIVVVCSDEDWESAGPALRDAFSVRERTIERQRVFDLKRVAARDVDMYRFRKNLLLMGGVNSDLMKDVMSEDAKVMVNSGESYMFGSLDGWAGNQILVMLVAPADKPLAQVVRLTGHPMFRYFKRESLERIRRRIYSSGIEEETKIGMKEKYGWSIDLPKAYRVASEDSAGGLVSFIKHIPERVISVYWGFEKGDGSWVDIRDEMAAEYLQGDRIDRRRYREMPVTFRGYEATKLAGHWENQKKVMGGPFVSYCFQDTVSGTYYMVDYNVFAPGEKKWPITGQMEWIAQTFTIHH